MSDTNIQYYCYNNKQGDDFGVGYIGNKEFWVGIINRWNKNERSFPGFKGKITSGNWEELKCNTDFRGCELAKIVPSEEGSVKYKIYWNDGRAENSAVVAKDGTVSWENNPQNNPSVPRWISNLKKQLRSNNS
jgi:hypothetical protein